MFVKTCKLCNKNFEARRRTAVYCTIDCRKKSYLIRTGKESSLGLPTGTVGAISELLVFSDLLKKGYEAYRPLTANCSGDILIEKDKTFIKIEVRTGYRHRTSNNLSFSPHNIRAEIIAVVVLQDNEIIYLNSYNRQRVIL